MVIQSYLTFNGNCLEAMKFYQTCLGGELEIQKIGDSPLTHAMPAKMKDAVLHAKLSKGELVILGSDMVPDSGRRIGNAVALMLNCESEAQLFQMFDRLSRGGKIVHPVEKTFWGGLLGDFVDKFGNSWILHHTRSTLSRN